MVEQPESIPSSQEQVCSSSTLQASMSEVMGFCISFLCNSMIIRTEAFIVFVQASIYDTSRGSWKG